MTCLILRELVFLRGAMQPSMHLRESVPVILRVGNLDLRIEPPMSPLRSTYARVKRETGVEVNDYRLIMCIKHDIAWIEIVVRKVEGVDMMDSVPNCRYVVVGSSRAAIWRMMLAQVAWIDHFHQGLLICFKAKANYSSVVGNFTAVIGGQILVRMPLEYFACLYILKHVQVRPKFRVVC